MKTSKNNAARANVVRARPLPKDGKAALERFRDEVCLRAKEVDPDEDQDWYALSLGFFLALGVTIKKAHRLAIYARYEAHYWVP